MPASSRRFRPVVSATICGALLIQALGFGLQASAASSERVRVVTPTLENMENDSLTGFQDLVRNPFLPDSAREELESIPSLDLGLFEELRQEEAEALADRVGQLTTRGRLTRLVAAAGGQAVLVDYYLKESGAPAAVDVSFVPTSESGIFLPHAATLAVDQSQSGPMTTNGHSVRSVAADCDLNCTAISTLSGLAVSVACGVAVLGASTVGQPALGLLICSTMGAGVGAAASLICEAERGSCPRQIAISSVACTISVCAVTAEALGLARATSVLLRGWYYIYGPGIYAGYSQVDMQTTLSTRLPNTNLWYSRFQGSLSDPPSRGPCANYVSIVAWAQWSDGRYSTDGEIASPKVPKAQSCDPWQYTIPAWADATIVSPVGTVTADMYLSLVGGVTVSENHALDTAARGEPSVEIRAHEDPDYCDPDRPWLNGVDVWLDANTQEIPDVGASSGGADPDALVDCFDPIPPTGPPGDG